MKVLLLVVAFLLASCGGTGKGYTVIKEISLSDSDCPLCEAAKRGDLYEVDLLLSAGMNPNSVSSSMNVFARQTEGLEDPALRFAVASGNAKIVRAFLDSGADVNKTNKNGSTPLSASTNLSSADITKILLAAGANPNLINKSGKTSLMLAAEHGRTETVKILLDKGANINESDAIGDTALMSAVFYGHDKTVKFLLERGAQVNLKDASGWTAINSATHKGYAQIVRMLLNCGASPGVRNKHGHDAWYWAKKEPVMDAILNQHLAEFKAGKIIESCGH